MNPSVQRPNKKVTYSEVQIPLFLSYIHPLPTSKRNYFKQKHLIDNFEEKYKHDYIYTLGSQNLHPG